MSPPFSVIKVSDEGSSSPFIARIFFGMLKFRDQLYLPTIRDADQSAAKHHFDRRFKPMLEAAQGARDAAVEINRLVSSHLNGVFSGQVVRIRENQYDILSIIDNPLSQAVDKLIDQSVVAIKTGLQALLRDPLGLEIGFLFSKDVPFQAGIDELRATGETRFAEYLERARESWLEPILQLRADHEHHGWSLASVQYQLASPSSVEVAMPKVLGLPVQKFARLSANRVLLFIEDTVVYAMQRRCRYPIDIVEIPTIARDPSDPQRFQLAPRGLDPSPAWAITYSDDQDFV